MLSPSGEQREAAHLDTARKRTLILPQRGWAFLCLWGVWPGGSVKEAGRRCYWHRRWRTGDLRFQLRDVSVSRGELLLQRADVLPDVDGELSGIAKVRVEACGQVVCVGPRTAVLGQLSAVARESWDVRASDL